VYKKGTREHSKDALSLISRKIDPCRSSDGKDHERNNQPSEKRNDIRRKAGGELSHVLTSF